MPGMIPWLVYLGLDPIALFGDAGVSFINALSNSYHVQRKSIDVGWEPLVV
jgi:hypothetical protein